MSILDQHAHKCHSIRQNCRRGQTIALALVLTVIGLIASLTFGTLVLAQSTGVIEGQVVNGTASAAEIGPGLRVVLHVVQDGSEVKSLETTTGDGGRFRFEGLDTDEFIEYWPEAYYEDLPYSNTQVLSFTANQTTLAATITVYETTSDDSAISIGPLHLIAESFEQVLRISEVNLFGNDGDRTFTGSGEPLPGATGEPTTTVFIPLPANAVGLGFTDQAEADRFVEVKGGIMDTEPVRPGAQSSVASFSYHLVVSGDAVALERRFSYPVTTLNLLIAQPESADAVRWTVKSDQLESMGIQSLMDRQYEVFVAQNLGPDKPLVMEFVPASGALAGTGELPASSSTGVATASSRGSQGALRWLGFALAILVIVGAVVYPQLTTRLAPARRSSRALTSEPEARRLLAELADLETAFEEDRIDETSYERRRAEIYEKLRSL